ncbi:MAG: hypothetical protein Q9163_006528, partial [Psora crenata]
MSQQQEQLNLSHCVPADAPQLGRIHHTVFSRPPIYQAIYRNANPAEVLAKYEKNFITGLREQEDHQTTHHHHHPDSASSPPRREVHYLKITDDAINAIVAYAIWVYWPAGYDAERDPEAQAEGPLPTGSNVDLARDFKRTLGAVHGQQKGNKDPHL